MPPITLPPASALPSVRRELTADDPAVIVNALHFYADGIARQIDAIERTPIPLSDLLDPASAQNSHVAALRGVALRARTLATEIAGGRVGITPAGLGALVVE